MGWATQRGPRPRLVATSHRLASCVIVSGFRAALDLDTYPLRNLIRPRCAERAKPGRGKPCSLLKLLAFSLVFTPYLSNGPSQSFQQNRHNIFLALVTLKLLVSLISHLVACSARIVVDKHTHRQTQTDTQNDYCNPRCASAPRVNESIVVQNLGTIACIMFDKRT